MQKINIKMCIILIITFFLAACQVKAQEAKIGGSQMKLSSPEFKHKEFIPVKFTCQGEDINPTLIIQDVPDGAKSLALIVDDPDAPMGTWVHWVVFNIPVVSQIEEDSVSGEQAMNNFGREDYGGPCPPFGTHRYFFKIYALDTEIDSDLVRDKRSLEKAMEGHILDSAEIVGLYKK